MERKRPDLSPDRMERVLGEFFRTLAEARRDQWHDPLLGAAYAAANAAAGYGVDEDDLVGYLMATDEQDLRDLLVVSSVLDS